MLDTHFQALTGYTPRQFQRETITRIVNRENVILRAPTGSGKTETAIAPFLFSRLLNPDFPRKLIYVVPLRTLANSLRERAESLVKNWFPNHSLTVTLQTGENPEDPRFEGDIVFCTIDQMLSSFLNIPYSVGRGSANINAGVFFASYLVFDEIHLLDPDRSFTTLIEVLKQVNKIAPFLLMTATLTDKLVGGLQKEIGNPHFIRVGKEDLQAIEGNRKRYYTPISEPLTAATIVNNHKPRQIVICNTVSVSQALFQDLQDAKDENTEITLLHARFLPEHRREKEKHLSAVFGKDWQPDGQRHILIATQVIEAGLNLTCDSLHSQLCPMNSLLQRGGRCARFVGEEGTVSIYRSIAPSKSQEALAAEDFEENDLKDDKRQFLPYNYEICQSTWQVLTASRDGNPIGYDIEEEWINAVHSEENQLEAERRQNNRAEFANNFRDALFSGEQSVASDLIRDVQSRSLFVWEETPYIDIPDETTEINPQKLQAFSVPLVTLRGIFGKYQRPEHQRDWLFKRITIPKKKSYKATDKEDYSLPVCTKITSFSELTASFRILVNPNYLFYDDAIGLRIDLDQPGNQYTSPKKPEKPIPDQYRYRMDTYTRHLFNMAKCWREPFATRIYQNGETVEVTFASVRDELLAAGGKFIQTRIFPNASVADCESLYEWLVILAIFTHDLGKLQTKWQTVMRGWQEIAYREFNATNPKNLLLAHTDYNPEDEEQKARLKEYEKKNRRPPHAVESAFLSQRILKNCLIPFLEDQFQATREQAIAIAHTLIMASGRHHSAWSSGWDIEKSQKIKQIQLHPDGRREIVRSWKALRRFLPEGFTIADPYLTQDGYETKELSFGREPFDATEEPYIYLQLYSLIARALRLCDQRSVQL
jgi:CRISPR-associated endonuclease/helicase Cas3